MIMKKFVFSSPCTGVRSYAARLYNILGACLLHPDQYQGMFLKPKIFREPMTPLLFQIQGSIIYLKSKVAFS